MKTQVKVARVSIQKAVETLLEVGARQTVVYQHPNLTVKATRQRKPDKRTRSETIILTIGRPAHAERKRIKLLTKAGEPFPVRKVSIKFYPSR